jgi:Leucine-rich repeat (LRR) protein
MLRFNPLFDAARVGKPMPEEVFGIERLVYLDYSRMGLTEVSPAIASLNTLKTLLLDGNALTVFPVEVCQVLTLEKLHLKGNRIADLPPGLSDCKMLEMIDLRGNPLTPEARAALPGLLPADCKVKLD